MDNKKEVVFIEGYQTVMLYKIAKELRKNNYKTILIRILEQDELGEGIYKQGYDEIIDLNLSYYKVTKENFSKIILSMFRKSGSLFKSLFKIIKLKPYIVIGRAPLSTPIAIFRILFRKTPFVYFPYDIMSQALATQEEARKRHLPLFEIKADRFCFENSDGILHKGAPEELDYINGRMLGDNIKLPKHTLAFHPYCSDEFIMPLNKNKLSKKDKEIHLVYIGGTGRPTTNFYYSQMDSVKEILKQKIHIHMYFSSYVSFEKDNKKLRENAIKKFYEEYKDFEYIKYFHIYDSENPKDIVYEISKYDFGMFTPQLSIIAGMEPRFCTGNKISTYLEAGIAFFYRDNYKYINRIMKKYSLDFKYPKDFTKFKPFIKKIKISKMNENIIKARKDFNINKHFPNFHQFIEKVAESKK